MTLLLHRSLVREKIAQLGLRYVILIDGATIEGDWEHHIAAGGGYGSFGWAGYGNKGQQTHIDAFICDLEEPASSANLSGAKSDCTYHRQQSPMRAKRWHKSWYNSWPNIA